MKADVHVLMLVHFLVDGGPISYNISNALKILTSSVSFTCVWTWIMEIIIRQEDESQVTERKKNPGAFEPFNYRILAGLPVDFCYLNK